MHPPQTRASYAQDVQAEVMKLSDADRDAIMERSGEAWGRIERALPQEWIEEVTYYAMVSAIRIELGDEGMRALYRRMGRVIAKTPLFDTAVSAMIRLSGLTPHTALKFVPRGRNKLVRHSGDMSYEKLGPTHAVIRLRGFPPATFEKGSTMILLAGSFEGIVEAFRGEPQLEIEGIQLDKGNCDFNIRWTAKSSPSSTST